jgi:hypothetical protein
MPLESMDELNDKIRAGYGDIPSDKIPADWRTRPPNGIEKFYGEVRTQPTKEAMEGAQVLKNARLRAKRKK